ncbi:hypothetical protein, partial [Vibrio cholerae]|uniref:hypothetical protein n=2 Tax=Vibrio cholerae TaxID=666 RepID=UPI001966BDF1
EFSVMRCQPLRRALYLIEVWMGIPVTIYVAIGAITAALVAGYFSFSSMLIAKDQKTTEFRHESISKLREEVARFISKVSVFTSMIIYIEKEDITVFDKFINENLELIQELQEAYSLIRMRVNPKEDTDFLIKLDYLYSYVSGQVTDYTLDDVTIAEEALTVVTQQLLKREWTRIKTGERLYNGVKWATCILLLGLGCYLAYFTSKILPSVS